MRVAVVGHVEWIEFGRVEHVPRPGNIVHATTWWEEPGGGGAVAAVQLAKLAGGCALYTAVGADETGDRARRELDGLGLEVHAAVRPERTRRAVTFVDPSGERTITTLGERLSPAAADPLPWDELARMDAVYFTAGDPAAFRRARTARVLVATSRAGGEVLASGVEVDVLIGSANDPAEAFELGDPPARARLAVLTEGAEGGRYAAGGAERRYPPARLPAPVGDAYGAGDSFHAAVTFGLAAGLGPDRALALAARCGAAAATGDGPYRGQLGREDLADLLGGPSDRP